MLWATPLTLGARGGSGFGQAVMPMLLALAGAGCSSSHDVAATDGGEDASDGASQADGQMVDASDGGTGDGSPEAAPPPPTGIFVSPSGNDSSPGTMAAPVKTIGHALDLAKNAPSHRVNACAGTYGEQVTLDAAHDGIGLYGGFWCTDWSYAPTNVAKVAPTTQGYALTLTSLTTGTTIADVEFDAPERPGGRRIEHRGFR
jgi:hypothetical protein